MLYIIVQSKATDKSEDSAGAYENMALGRMVWAFKDNHLQVTMGAASSDAEIYDGPRGMFRLELTGGGEVATFAAPAGTDLPQRLLFYGYTFRRINP